MLIRQREEEGLKLFGDDFLTLAGELDAAD